MILHVKLPTFRAAKLRCFAVLDYVNMTKYLEYVVDHFQNVVDSCLLCIPPISQMS